MGQQWFIGVHSNVGGSYGDDGIANIALHWIAKGAVETGLALDKKFLDFYRPWFGDSLYESYKRFYKKLDGYRHVGGQGARPLLGYAREANLTVDRSVIQRMQLDVKKLEPNGDDGSPATAYRPQNVIEWLAALPDLDQYLRENEITHPLPDDVLAKIAELKRVRRA